MPNGPKVQVRNYDKGERRFKHVGRGSKPYIQFDEMQPRKWIGKCPDNIHDSKKKELLNKAVVAPSGDRDIDYVKQLYVVHEGAIYEAQTSDGGRSYHAYPYRGKLSKSLMEALEAMAVNEGTLVALRDWVGKYIEIGGKQ